MMIIEASAPSNIALIKYMGKLEGPGNRPTNSSLSYTLNDLLTYVRLTPIAESCDRWQRLDRSDLADIRLGEKAIEKFLRHFAFLKDKFEMTGSYLVESGNNFPSDCGLASSASSFAALTTACHNMAIAQGLVKIPLRYDELAELSRSGSGSSTRSFYSPWALWSSEGLRPIEFDLPPIHHQVFVVESGKKAVSSSQAHQRVLSSELFAGRPERAEKRLAILMDALRSHDWRQAYEVCWAEFYDMHALFESSHPPFGYFEPGTVKVLKTLRSIWDEKGDGPLVTMDAGANVHALYRQDQKNLAKQVQEQLKSSFSVLMSAGLRS